MILMISLNYSLSANGFGWCSRTLVFPHADRDASVAFSLQTVQIPFGIYGERLHFDYIIQNS